MCMEWFCEWVLTMWNGLCLISKSHLYTYLVTDLLTWLLNYLLAYLLTYSPTHSLTPHSTVLLQKLTGSQSVKKFHTFYGTRKFITAFTSLSLSWASSIQSIAPHPTFWRHALPYHTRYIPRQSHYSRFNHSRYSGWRVKSQTVSIQLLFNHFNIILRSFSSSWSAFFRYFSRI
jgi:hypothetical protein